MKNLILFEEYGFREIGFKPRVILFQGSPRTKDGCAGQTSKSAKVIDYAVENWSKVYDFEVVDLAVGEVTISPCKGCISTANGFHCHWKCSCYEKGMENPDYIYERGIYDLLEKCDAFVVVSPVNWYSVSTQVKALFDRLVCANLTLTQEQAIEILGKDNLKNAKVTGATELSGKYKHLLKNHLKGKLAAFYIHGNAGADDYPQGQPYTGEGNWSPKDAVMPIVYQCRYSEMIAPDELIEGFDFAEGLPYYEGNLLMPKEGEFFSKMDDLLTRLAEHLPQNPLGKPGVFYPEV